LELGFCQLAFLSVDLFGTRVLQKQKKAINKTSKLIGLALDVLQCNRQPNGVHMNDFYIHLRSSLGFTNTEMGKPFIREEPQKAK
jgi:hypothetical protein